MKQLLMINEKGYFEDRRPAANCDPYLVTSIICETTCEKIENFNIHIIDYIKSDNKSGKNLKTSTDLKLQKLLEDYQTTLETY